MVKHTQIICRQKPKKACFLPSNLMEEISRNRIDKKTKTI